MAATCWSFCPTASAPLRFSPSAPDWVADWKGARPGLEAAGPGRAGADRLVEGARPRSAREAGRAVRRDGHRHDRRRRCARCEGQVNLSFGWGTNLTNDFVGCAPAGVDGQLKAISLVCKVVEADGRPAVKLSDNPNKALGPPDEVRRYQRAFGTVGMKAEPVMV